MKNRRDTPSMYPRRTTNYESYASNTMSRYQARRSQIDRSYAASNDRYMGNVYQIHQYKDRTTSQKNARAQSNRVQRNSQRRSESKRTILSRVFVGKDAQYFDYELLLIILFLICFGLVMLYSASSYSALNDFDDDKFYFVKQARVCTFGFVWMMFVSKIDYHVYGAYSFEFYIFSMIMMALVQTPLGVTIYGARRWIELPGDMTLQPSEITKVAVILFISYELCRLGKKVPTKDGTIRIFTFGVIAAAGVMFLTDNLSTAIIVMAITCILYFVVHPQMKIFVKIIAVGGAAIAILVMSLAIMIGSQGTSDNFRIRRILVWLDPESNSDDGGFQVMQGLYAIGSGGFFGKGLGNSTQKLGSIPEIQNDMILTVICEELGVMGAIVVLVMFGFMLYRLMFVAQNAPDLYGSLIVTGIFGHIALQVILNIAVVTNLIPTTGVTLPFISYGGTSIVFLMTEMGIALGVSRKIQLNES